MAPSEAFEASGELVPPDSPLAHKLAHLPSRPGCYLFKDAAGKVIYVGKAVSLRNRVRSYFHQSRRHPARTAALVQNIADLDYIVTASEVEALILECNLIKEQSPRYNVRLKDDKAYPYIKVTDEAFPRVMVARRRGPDGRYFGPYTDAGAVRTTLAFLRKLFPIRTCSLDLSGELDYRPCLLYHIGRCGAPCAGLQSAAEYGAMIDEVCLFLEGRHDKLIPGLKRQMEAAAEALEFEKAARLRDQLGALQK
ncbi:MAG TPA: excinuclease ABC subunit UvrC, partial [Limnochordia bacterium]|nr:excinuclease ABC subunit UvrC [Limnochordia bacterium]